MTGAKFGVRLRSPSRYLLRMAAREVGGWLACHNASVIPISVQQLRASELEEIAINNIMDNIISVK